MCRILPALLPLALPWLTRAGEADPAICPKRRRAGRTSRCAICCYTGPGSKASAAFPKRRNCSHRSRLPKGYALLGVVIERASGLSYGDFPQSRLFAPLGMSTTAYRADDPAALSTWLFSAGGIISTARDLARWEEALYGGKG